MAATWAAVANEPGRHGFDLVGGFESKVAAEEWLSERKLSGIVKPLVAPDAWEPNDGSADDEPPKAVA